MWITKGCKEQSLYKVTYQLTSATSLNIYDVHIYAKYQSQIVDWSMEDWNYYVSDGELLGYITILYIHCSMVIDHK